MSETFMTIGRARKAVADMTKDEQLVAMRIAADNFAEAERELEPYQPWIEANYLPDTMGMCIDILARLIAVQEAHERLLRLCAAVTATGAH
jgi:hypothetical protein